MIFMEVIRSAPLFYDIETNELIENEGVVQNVSLEITLTSYFLDYHYVDVVK